MEDIETYEDFTNRVNRLYKGFSPMEIRRCVFLGIESQILDLKVRDILEMRRDSSLLDIRKLDDETIYALDISWDKQHAVGFNSEKEVVIEDIPWVNEVGKIDDDSNA